MMDKLACAFIYPSSTGVINRTSESVIEWQLRAILAVLAAPNPALDEAMARAISLAHGFDIVGFPIDDIDREVARAARQALIDAAGKP